MSKPRARDEQSMRANTTKCRNYLRMGRHECFDEVVALNRAYLEVAVPKAAATEKEYWALSCFPGTTPGRLSAISMKSMEVLVLLDVGEDVPDAFVVVSPGQLVASHGSVSSVEAAYPEVLFIDSAYRDAGADQIRVYGSAPKIMRCLRLGPFGAAAREIADRLMSSGKTMQWFGHNYQLADHVLGRAVPD